MTFIGKQAGLLRSARSWGVLGLVLALAVMFGSDSVTPAQSSVTVNAVITVDNFYRLCYGPAAGPVTCTDSSGNPMQDGSWTTTETYTFAPNQTDYIYIVAWSDDNDLQGFLGQFSVGSNTIRTGDPAFEVCATSDDRDLFTPLPSNSDINAKLLACNQGNWVTPVGTIPPAINGATPPSGWGTGPGNPWWGLRPGFTGNPTWIWHQSGKTLCSGPFSPLRPGCDHNEYLIFRLPVRLLAGGGQTGCVGRPLDMVAWWPLDEIQGDSNVVDLVLGNNGTPMMGNTPTTIGPGPGTGPTELLGQHVGNSLQFSTGKYVEVPDNSNLNFGQGDFSMDAWVRFTPGTQTEPIVYKMDTSGGYFLYLSTSTLGPGPADRLYLKIGSQIFAGPLITVPQGTWIFVAATRAGSTVNLYVGQGSTLSSVSVSGPGGLSASSNTNLLIGGWPGNPHAGLAIDELELFKRALTPIEIQDTFNAGPAGKCKSDLGDAPDSTNNFSAPMTANFPTVFNSSPPGPKHLQPKGLAWLGPDVSSENEADIGPDQDPSNNIIPGTNTADKDLKDDGVVLPIAIPMICGQTQFNYTVTSTVAAKLYVNVWFDFNRDGDWNDPIAKCPLGPAITGSFTEWAVQNDLITVPGPGTFTFTTPVFGAANPTNGSQMWMRITLTDTPIAPAQGADGSGPAGRYQYGETEDYLLRLTYSELCGIKFNDLNGNGTQDPGEPGLANWVIEVKDANGNIIGYAVTDAQGRYCVVVPVPGTYTVSEQQQPGWTQTFPVNPPTHTVTVPPAHTNLNFGNQRKEGKAEICVFKFEDLDGDGVRDPNEPLLPGWQFNVSPAPLPPATSPVTTLPSGGICFGVSAPGTYTITELVQAGWTPTTPNPQTVTVTPSQLVNVFFGNKKKEEKFEICGIKWNDLDGDGVRDPNEPGLPGWTINMVFGTPPNQIDVQATTDANGRYCFKGLAPGTYTVSETLQPGWVQTFPPSPGTYTVTVPPSRTDINFGNKMGVCDREIKKTVTPNPVQSGGTVTITLTVTNVGTAPCPVVAGINVADPQPTGMTFQPPPTGPVSVNNPGWSCFRTGPSGAWPGGVQCTATSPLLPGAANAVTITFTATVTAPAGSQIQNCAEVTNVGDANQANNKDCVTINVMRILTPVDLALAKLLDGQLRVEQDATYVLRVTNVGGAPTTGPIRVTDPLPPQLRFVSATGPGWSCSAEGQNVTCTSAGPLAPNASSTILLRVRVSAPAGTQITNCATVETAGDANPANNRGCHTGTVQR